MVKLLVAVTIIIGFATWCCLKIGAEADKAIEKLERPDSIKIKK